MTCPRVLLVAACIVLLSGCGSSDEKPVAVNGKLVVQGGEPFRPSLPGNKPLPPGDPGVRVKFIRLDGNQQGADKNPQEAYIAEMEEDSNSFHVPGPKGKGIPAGRYQVVVFIGAAGAPDPKAAQKVAARPPTENDAEDEGPNLDGNEILRQEVTVPQEGLPDLTIEVPTKKR